MAWHILLSTTIVHCIWVALAMRWRNSCGTGNLGSSANRAKGNACMYHVQCGFWLTNNKYTSSNWQKSRESWHIRHNICAYTESKKHTDTHPFGAGHHIVPFACRRTNIGLIIIIQMLEMENFTINLFMFENMKIRKVSISSAKCVLEVFQFIWHLFYSCDVYDGLWIVVNNVCWGVVSYVGLWMTKQWTLNRER